jgi:protein SCO1
VAIPEQTTSNTRVSTILIYVAAALLMVAVLAAGIYYLLGLLTDSEPGVIDLADEQPLVAGEQNTSVSGVTILEPPTELGDFTLTANNGEPLSLSNLEGQLALVYFGYTYCPDACPATLLDFRRIKQSLDDRAAEVTFVFISVDGERDTPELLNTYLARYDPEFIGLTGDEDAVREIANEYHVFFERRESATSAAHYLVDHTASRFLIDQEGRLARIYSAMTDASVIAEDILDLLSSDSP